MLNYNETSSLSIDSAQNIPVVPADRGFEPKSSGVGGWFDTFTARQITFPDGQTEICVMREKHFAGSALGSGVKAKRGESDNPEKSAEAAGRRAKKQVRQCCKMIGADRMITLTYRENMTDRDRALRDFDKFRRRLGKCVDFHYVAVIEAQKRGALHFHIAVRGRQSYHLLRSIWQDITGLDDFGRKMGQINVRNPNRFGFGSNALNKLAAYISKYCSKDMEAVRGLNQKRYFRSRGIVLPEVKSWYLVNTDFLSAVETAFSIAAGHNLNDLQTWCNNSLGIMWIATSPGIPDPFKNVPF